jgi:hypothetical protein
MHGCHVLIKKEMVVPLRKKEMATHPLRVQLTRGKLMKKYLGGMKWRLMRMNMGGRGLLR